MTAAKFTKQKNAISVLIKIKEKLLRGVAGHQTVQSRD